MWLARFEDDILSDMSRFHGIQDLETITAYRYVSFAIRLAAYDGCLAGAIRREAEDEERELETRGREALNRAVVQQDGSREALENDPLFAGLGAFSTAPLAE